MPIAKGVELGGYTLMCASRNVGDDFNCVDPDTGATRESVWTERVSSECMGGWLFSSGC